MSVEQSLHYELNQFNTKKKVFCNSAFTSMQLSKRMYLLKLYFVPIFDACSVEDLKNY